MRTEENIFLSIFDQNVLNFYFYWAKILDNNIFSFFVYLYRKIASGRSARLPPTPMQTTNMRHSLNNVNITGGYTAASLGLRNGSSLNALSSDFTTSQVLDSLSDREKQIILDVLNRDEEVRQRESARIMWVAIFFSFYFWIRTKGKSLEAISQWLFQHKTKKMWFSCDIII